MSRLVLDAREDGTTEPLAARFRHYIHALYFAVSRIDAQRAARHGRAIAARDEEADRRLRELVEAEQVVALRWIQ